MNEDLVNAGSLPGNEEHGATDPSSSADTGSAAGLKEVARTEHPSHSKSRKWIHQIVNCGWEGISSSSPSPPRPPSPTVPPPAWDGRSVTFRCWNAPASSSSGHTATALLCRHCHCPDPSLVRDGYPMYERMASHQKDTAVKVRFWESVPMDPPSEGAKAVVDVAPHWDQTLVCISLRDVLEPIASTGMEEEPILDNRLWRLFATILRAQLKELEHMAEPITVILLGVVKSDALTADDFLDWFSSEALSEIMASFSAEFNRRLHWYTPILFAEEDGITPMVSETLSRNKKRKSMTSLKPKYGIDYCFQSIIEQALSMHVEKCAVAAATEVVEAFPEANDPSEKDRNESPSPKKQRTESADAEIDLTATVSVDAEDSPKVAKRPSPSARRQRTSSATYAKRTRS